MPLTQLPANNIGRIGNREQPQIAQRESSLRSKASTGIEKVGSLHNPSSIQSMLRNTTETGDVGQFSIKPTRAPLLIPRTSPSSSTKARSTSDMRHPPKGPHQGPDENDARQMPMLSRQGTTVSSAASGFHPQSQISYRRPSQGPSLDEYRSFSMTQSSYASHSLTNRQPYANGNHQIQGDPSTARPRSPFAYPTRLKRPGYRPSSPALSDLNKSISGSDFDRGPNSRTASPASMYTMSRVPTPGQQGVNRLDPALRYYPASQVPGPARLNNAPSVFSRPSTPAPASSLRSVASSSHLPRTQPPRNGVWTGSQSSPQSPLFYDYTEAFEEQTHFHRFSVSMVNLTQSSIPEDGVKPFFEADGSQGLEYPTRRRPDNYSPKEAPHAPDADSSHAPEINARSLVPEPSPQQHFAEAFELPTSQTSASKHATELNTKISLPATPLNRIQVADPPVRPVEEEPPKSSMGSSEDTPSSDAAPASDQGSSTSTDSMYSADSSSCMEPRDDTSAPNTVSKMATTVSPKSPKTPITDLDRSALAAKGKETSESQPRSDPSFEGNSMTEHTEIFAPTPERSITSPSSRDRFSKILSIDDGLLELDELAHTLHRQDSRLSKISYTGPKRKSYLRLRESLSNAGTAENTIADNMIAEETDSEDEHELTIGLRETFCRPEQPEKQQIPTPLPTMLPSSTMATCSSPVPPKAQIPPKIEKPISSLQLHSQQSHAKALDENIKAEDPGCAPFSDLSLRDRLRVNKALPLLPKDQPAVVSFSPLAETAPTDLPFAFTPLIQRASEDDSIAELEAVTASYLKQSDDIGSKSKPLPLKPKVRLERMSSASPPGSRPWNLDASYPWSDQLPKLDVTMPLPSRDSQEPTERPPRFKLKIHRASTSTGRRSKITKSRQSSSDTSSSRVNSSLDFIKATSLKRRAKPNPIGPEQSNSSHDIFRSSPMQTRFIESFENHSQTSPAITLLPPSPGHEVRSFFSDDSSQVRPKGSLRKRLSDFRARSRATSTDEGRGYDRGLLSSALGRSRASGRSSRQSQNTTGTTSRESHIRQVRWKVIDVLRSWFHRGDDKVREWGWKRRYRNERNRDAHTPLYAGV